MLPTLLIICNSRYRSQLALPHLLKPQKRQPQYPTGMSSTYGYFPDYGIAPTDLNITGYHTIKKLEEKTSVADPGPSDPYVFGPPGSGSGSTSQSTDPGFLSSSKKSKKNLVCDLFLTFYL
jgi:hypothetical protein